LLGLARARYAQGDLGGAKRWLDEAEPALQKSGDKALSGLALAYTGDIHSAQGDLAEARVAYDQALKILKSAGARRYAAETEVASSRLTIEEGRAGDAEASLRSAISKLHQEGDTAGEIVAHAVLVRALLSKGTMAQNGEAQRQVTAAVSLLSNLQSPQTRMELTIAAARAAAALGADAKARATLEGTIDEAARFGFLGLNYEARLALGQIEMSAGKTGAGRFRLRALEKDATTQGFLLIARQARASVSGK
jgi:tetratricopeptide (TPR) repeat protein